MEDRIGVDTDSLLKRIDQTWMLIIVGDAWMSPYRLTHREAVVLRPPTIHSRSARSGYVGCAVSTEVCMA